MFRSFRSQLTAWYLLFFAGLLVGFSAFLYFELSRNLLNRLDSSLADTASSAARLFRAELGEQNGAFQPAAEEALEELRLPRTRLVIFEGGHLLAASTPELAGHARLLLQGTERNPVHRTISGPWPGGARAFVMPFQAAGQTCFLAAVEPLDSIAAQLAELRRLLLWALPLTLLFASLGGYLLATRSLSPLTAIAEQAEQITASSLHRRLQTGAAKEELARLAAVFNDLLSRLDRSFAAMREFVADASHELRTPLAVIRGEADVCLSQDRDSVEYRESLAIIQDEVRRLSRLVDDLLHLARADAGFPNLQARDFYLNEVVEECLRALQPLARQKNIDLSGDCPADILFCGDPELLRRMLANLLENAVRYTLPGGRARVTLENSSGVIRIAVSDTGVGIPPEAVGRVFERFYRVDKSRSRADGGFGLGLAIVKWIAETHRGTVQVESRPGVGSTFRVVLPAEKCNVYDRGPAQTEITG